MTRKETEQLLNRYGQSIFGFCCHLAGSRETGEELYQDTMLKAIELSEKIIVKPEDGLAGARNYCMGIAVRLYRNRVRKESLREHLSVDDEEAGIGLVLSGGETPEESVLSREEMQKIRTAVRSLPEKYREVVYLYYYADESVKDIASTLRIPSGTVKSRLNAARKMLKKLLEEEF